MICINSFFSDQTITNESLKLMVDKAVHLYKEKTGLLPTKVTADLGTLIISVDTESFRFSDLL